MLGGGCEEATFLRKIIQHFGSRSSLFVEPTELGRDCAARECGADRVELRTGPYANEFVVDRERAVAPVVKAGQYAHQLGLGVNAGHDLTSATSPSCTTITCPFWRRYQ